MIQQTSIEAFQSIGKEGKIKTQKEKVLNIIRGFPEGITREGIWEISKIRYYSSIAARCRALLKENKIFQNENNVTINKSGKKAMLLRSYL